MPELTVLLPVYNGAAFLQEAIESVLGQTFRDFELLVVDDGSTDETPSILDRQADPRLRVLRSPERLKLSGALNYGWESSVSEFIARMDADDLCLPERFSRQLAYLRAHPEVGICGTAIRKIGAITEDVLRYPASPDLIRAFALFNSPFSHPSVILRRGFFDREELRFNGDYYPTEDFELWARALTRFPGANLQEPLLRYRVHPDSMTRADWGAMDEKAAIIMGRQLAAMGIPVTESRRRLHRDVGMRRIRAEEPAVQEAEEWLLSILAANEVSGIYDVGALGSVVADLWFQICMGVTSMGRWILGRYLASPLSNSGSGGLRRKAVLLASIARNSL